MTTFKPPTCKHGCTDECIECIEEKAYAAGKREAAETILKLWHDPWGVTEMPFIERLKLYVEELKAEAGRETQFLIASSGAERPARLPGILGGSGSGAN